MIPETKYLYIQCKDQAFGWRDRQTMRVPWTREKFEHLRKIVIDGMCADDNAGLGGVMSGQARYYLEQSGLSRAEVKKLESEVECRNGLLVGCYSFLGYIMCLTVRVRLNDTKDPERIDEPTERARWSRPMKGYESLIRDKK